MGLLAHYPLNGDTKDYSGNENHAINNGAIIDNNGKIGRCYSFNGGSSRLDCGDIELKGYGSIALWIKSNRQYPGDSTPTIFRSIIGKVDGGGSGQQSYYMDWHGGNTTRTLRFGIGNKTKAKTLTISQELTSWTHVVATFDDCMIYIYINGTLKASTPHDIQIENMVSSTKIGQFFGGWDGQMNDVRIYNHALSGKEIKELAKAKILHYTFDDFQEPTVNLATGNISAYTPYNVITNRVGQNLIITMQSGTQFLTLSNGVDYNGKIITLSGIMKKNGKPHALPGDRANTYHTLKAAKWFFDPLTGYFEIVENCNTSSGWTFHTPSGTVAGDIITIDNFQIEEKDHATPFTPSSRSGKVTDMSGYRNDAVLNLTTTPQWTSDSKIGGGTYKFNGINQWFAIPNSQCKVTDAITVSAWAYRDNWNQATKEIIISCTESGGWQLGFNNTSGQISFLLLANGSYRHAMYPAASITTGWHLITGTFDGRYVKLYIDSQLKSTIDISVVCPVTYNSTNGIFIGAEAGADSLTPFGEYWTGIIDDVRIYATALSQQDIEELYKIRASIDDGGNLYAAQILENTEPTENCIFPNYLTKEYIAWSRDTTTVSFGISSEHYAGMNYSTIWIDSKTSGTGNCYINGFEKIDQSKKSRSWTFSCYLKRRDGNPVTGVGAVYMYVNSVASGARINSNKIPTAIIDCENGWYRVVRSETVSEDSVVSLVGFSDLSSVTEWLLSGWQLEQKDHATPFTSGIREKSDSVPAHFNYSSNAVTQTGMLSYEDISEAGITNGLVAYYPFDKDSKDYSGYGNHGTLSGTVTTVGGVDGNAKLFKVAGDKMAINSISGDVLTLCAWHKWDTASTNWRTLFGNTGNYHHLIFNNDRSLNIFDGSTRKFNYSVPDNNWHHYVVVINSGVNASLYVDGVFNSKITIALNLKTYPVQFIGNYGGNSYPCGTLDEVRIYDRPLAAEEVAILYDTTRPDKPSVKLTKDMLYLSGELKEGL